MLDPALVVSAAMLDSFLQMQKDGNLVGYLVNSSTESDDAY